MMHSLQFQVFLMRFFRRIKAAFANAFAVNHDLCAPFSLVRGYAKIAGLVCFSRASHVLQITKTRHFSKVAKTVVQRIAVDMVYVLNGPRAGHPCPCQSMRQTFFVMDSDSPVAHIRRASRYFSYKIWSSVMRFPHKYAGKRIVIQNGTDMLNGIHDINITIGAA